MAQRQPVTDRGLTLVELIVVIVLVVVLFGVIEPVLHNQTDRNWRQGQCGNNLKQIAGACITYGQAEEVAWPLPFRRDEGAPSVTVADAHEARLVTVRAFQILAVNQTLPNSVFTCPTSAFPGPKLRPGDSDPIAWGAAPDHAVSYAFDWASPADPSSSRVVFADRDPANHKGAVMVAFGDSHTKKLKALAGTATGILTENNDGKPVTTIVGNPDGADSSGPDNIFSPAGDGVQDPFSPGTGGPLRSWVK